MLNPVLPAENLGTKTDAELVILTLKDKDYYRYLVGRYEDKLMRYIIRLSGLKQEDAQDVLQDVFIKTYQALNDFDARLKFSSWIYRITHNETINHLRKMYARPQVISSEASELILGLLHADLHIEDDIDKNALAEKLAQIIQKLDEKYRDVIILKYMEAKDYNEISDILKKPMGTVATLLKRAKEELKKEILNNKSLVQLHV